MEQPGNQMKVLVIDDEVAFANNIAKLLSKRGYRVTVVNDGMSATREVEEEEFDVAILDLKMPGMDGIETLKKLKARSPLLEVIMLTGHGSVESGIQGMEQGAFDYAMKPIRLDELLDKISQAYERRLLNLQRIVGS
jgi:two-component system, OmpR family, response regulator